MPRIRGFRVSNYRTLKDLEMGMEKHQSGLTPLTVIIGKNGTGKSTLVDAFVFLADCLKFGVETACDLEGRGGFEKLRSPGSNAGIFLGLLVQTQQTLLAYSLWIDLDRNKRPYVKREALGPWRASKNFMEFREGQGFATAESQEKIQVDLRDSRRLGLGLRGLWKEHPDILALRHFIEDWYLSRLTPTSTRMLPYAGPQRTLTRDGENLANVIQHLEREHPRQFQKILDKLTPRIPGLQKIRTEKSPDGRLLLRFNDQGFQDPFYTFQISDGTLRLLAYLLLLHTPTPANFITLEEPENNLYHRLLEVLVAEFRDFLQAERSVLLTTHSPILLNALTLEEVWILSKGEDGLARIHRASEDPVLPALVNKGIPLGDLWQTNHLSFEAKV